LFYQTANSRGSAQNLRSVRFNLEFRGHPPFGGLLRSGRIALFVPRVNIFHASKTTRYSSGYRGSSLRHLMDAAEVLTAIRSGSLGMAHPQKKRQSGMTFLRIVIPLYLFVGA